MAVGFKQTHLPWLVPKAYYDKFSDADIKLPDNCYVPNDLPDSSFYGSTELLEYDDIAATGFEGTETECLNDDDTKSLR